MINRLRDVATMHVNCLNSKKGQSVVEYALILLLIAIVVVAMLKGIGGQTNTMYSKVNAAFT